ncbi:MAG: transporter, family, multidrug resistance protein [Pseudomonadota bacterium]|nr:transporter, family, multidrug resistance protein [Pseudomonadota bacterium]
MTLTIQTLKRRKNYIIALSVLMYCVGMSSTDIYISLLPKMIAEFQDTAGLVNITISIYNLGIAISVLCIGEISERYGRKNVLLAGIIVFSISAALIAFTSSLGIIICLRFVQAVACSTIIVVPRLIFKDFMDIKEFAAANALLLMGLVLATSFAPILGAYVGKYYSWRACFILSSMIGVVAAIACSIILVESNINKLQRFASLPVYLNKYWNVFRNTQFLTITMIYAMNIGAYFTFIGLASYLYIVDWKITAEIFSLIYALMSLAYFMGNITMQYLIKRDYSVDSIILLGVKATLFAIAILILTLIIPLHSLQIIFLTLSITIIRFASALIAPSTQVLLLKCFDQNNPSIALGLNMFMGFAIGSFSVYIGSFFINYAFYGIIFLTIAFSSLSVLVALLRPISRFRL